MSSVQHTNTDLHVPKIFWVYSITKYERLLFSTYISATNGICSELSYRDRFFNNKYTLPAKSCEDDINTVLLGHWRIGSLGSTPLLGRCYPLPDQELACGLYPPTLRHTTQLSVSGLWFITYSCCQRRYEQIWNLLLMVQGTFMPRYILLFSVGNGAMNALQRYNELLRHIGNGAMNSSAILVMIQWTSPRYWKLPDDDACNDVETRANTPAALQREWGTSVQPLKKFTDKSDAYPYGTLNFFVGGGGGAQIFVQTSPPLSFNKHLFNLI
jgi:hypothetical protein